MAVSRSRTSRVHGHFGELLQGRLGPSGPVALVTLPCTALSATATFSPGSEDRFEVSQHQPLDTDQVTALRSLVPNTGPGHLHLSCDMLPGGGAGASTATRLAIIRALTGKTDPDTERALCLRLEGATDPLMFDAPETLLWAPREARALEALPKPTPLDVVGTYVGPSHRTNPADEDFADISDLIDDWKTAKTAADFAALATQSALRNTSHRNLTPLDPFLALARAHGALGIAAAHTGSAVALLFGAGDGDQSGAARALEALGPHPVIRFRAC